MSMSRDGLLPKAFSRIHPKYKTPSFATVVTGFVVAIPALFLNLDIVISLCSIGTLFAFVLVCGGILVLQNDPNKPESRFKTPFISSKYIVPAGFIGGWAVALIFFPQQVSAYFSFTNTDPEISDLSYVLGKLPFLAFIILSAVISVLSYRKNFSLIPVLGLLSCFYLMTGESWTNWARFIIWLVVGLIIYFLYGIRKSKLNREV
jgi:amino acid transporter